MNPSIFCSNVMEGEVGNGEKDGVRIHLRMRRCIYLELALMKMLRAPRWLHTVESIPNRKSAFCAQHIIHHLGGRDKNPDNS